MDIILAVIIVTGLSMFTLWYTKYAFSILIHTAEGYSETPDFGDNIIRPLEDFRPAKLIIVLLIHTMILGNIFVIDLMLGYFYAIILFVYLPAIISILAMENNLLQAFNINEITEVIKRSGKGYWLSFAFYCVTALTLQYVYDSEFGLFIAVVITLYLILVSFHMIGLTLYLHRKEIGYATVHSPEQDADDTDGEKIKQYERIATNIYSRYRQPSALPYLIEQLKHENVAAYDWFFDEIMSWEIKPKFKRAFMEVYLRKLCGVDLLKQTSERYTTYMVLDPDFIIDNNETRLCMLRMALSQRDKSLITIFSHVLLADKSDKGTHQKTILLLLHYYLEQQANDKKAHQLLTLIDKYHPDLIDNETVVSYRAILKNAT